ncbi:hypothetical protein D3C87_27220 [compost metagenome]
MEKYLQPIEDFIEKNDWYSEEAEFIQLQYDIVDRMEEEKVGFEAVESILKLMEKNPLVEFGTPGPLTHFIEKFYKDRQDEYETCLKQSVEQKPTVHTVWLLNRVINGSKNEKQKEFIGILNSISKDQQIQKDIRDVADNFLEYHKGN